jgi:hypothetical protein
VCKGIAVSMSVRETPMGCPTDTYGVSERHLWGVRETLFCKYFSYVKYLK